MLRKKAGMVGLVWVLALMGMGEAWAVVSWDGGGDGVLWSNDENWNPDGVPESTDDVYISSDDDIEMDMSSTTIASLTVDARPAAA